MAMSFVYINHHVLIKTTVNAYCKPKSLKLSIKSYVLAFSRPRSTQVHHQNSSIQCYIHSFKDIGKLVLQEKI